MFNLFSKKERRIKIIQALQGIIDDPISKEKVQTLFVFFVSIHNGSNHPFFPKNFAIEINIGNGFEKLCLLDERVHLNVLSSFAEIVIPEFSERLLSKNIVPFHPKTKTFGYLAFTGNYRFHQTRAHRFRISYRDGTSERSAVINPSLDFISISKLQSIFGIQIINALDSKSIMM